MQEKKRILYSALLAFLFLIISYWVTNRRFPVSGEKGLLTIVEKVCELCSRHEEQPADSVLFINVTYDKEPRPILDEMGIPSGRTPITDRHKLLKLLQHLQQKNDYKYLLLDVFFGDDITTEWDSALFHTIQTMERIVIPCHRDQMLADEKLRSKAGLADYNIVTTESDFVKYPYITHRQKSLPLKMFEEVTGRKISRHGIFYTDGWRLARNSIILTFDIRASEMYDDEGNKIWYNLGMDLLGDSIPELNLKGDRLISESPQLTSQKYIVIGSFLGDDMHTTFVGELSGAVINFNAFLSLMNGHHIVSFTLALILFVVFFMLFYLILSRKSLHDVLLNKSASTKSKCLFRLLRGMAWLLKWQWINYSLLLSVLCIATYLLLGEAYDIFITSTLFYLFSGAVSLYDKHQKHSFHDA
ncbi:MAG: hypothetical protein IJ244_05665 [Bacteroidaceae bacterium]|nr:hypothetical protein [Bacteroidaceae bacterium]